MAEIRVSLSIGLVGCRQEDVIEIPDEDLEGLTSGERDKIINEWVQVWMWNHVELDWEDTP